MKKVRDLVESVKMWVKFDKEQAIVTGVLVGSLTIFGLGWFVGDYGTVSNTTHKELQEKYNELENDFNSLQHSKNNYEKLANNATSYNKLNSTEKELVDSYIKEVMEKSEEEKEIESFRNTYKPMYEVVASGKSYYDMDDTEKAYIDSFLDTNFEDSPQTLQEEYKDKFDFYSANREESRQRVIDEENAKKAAEEEAKRQAEAQKYETGLTWEQIAREEKVGTCGKFEGKIIQVVDNGMYKSYRVAINGDYDYIMYVTDSMNKATETLLEDDYVYFKGESLGNTTYTTVTGSSVTIPAFRVHEITR